MIILEKIVLWLRLWSYQMIILCCGCSCGLFLEKNWVVVGVVVSYCTKIGLMLLLGCVIKSNCGCGCGRSSQVDCVVVVVVVDHFSFCTSLVPTVFISVPTKSNFFLLGGAGAPPGPLGKYAYVSKGVFFAI